MKPNIVPKASPDALPELAAFLEPFAPLFRRHTSRDSMERYLTGLLSDLPHKTADTIAAAVAGTSTERLQHLLTDAGYGDNPNFLAGLDTRRVPSICGVESTFGVRLPQEVQTAATEVPAYGGRGQPRKPRPAPLYSVKQLIEALPESAWQTISWREGTKGTMQAQVVAIRVHWATGSSRHSTSHSRVHTGPEGWLLAERPTPVPTSHEPSTDSSVSAADTAKPEVAEEQEVPETKYWFSSLPPETSRAHRITLAHARSRDRAVLRRCQAGMWSGRLPGATLGWVASASRPGHARLHVPGAPTPR